MSLTLVLTGFNAFPGVSENPSELLLRRIEETSAPRGIRRHMVILDTSYRDAEQQIARIIDKMAPDYLISFGVRSTGQDQSPAPLLYFERFGLNIDDAERADNRGDTRRGTPIIQGAPLAYAAMLPYGMFFHKLQQSGVRSAYSNHAGSYVCNHLLYSGLHHIAETGSKTKFGFIHVPQPTPPTVTTDQLVAAVELLLQSIYQQEAVL